MIAVVCGSLQKTLKRKSNKTVVASMAATLSGLFSNPQLAQVPGATAAILQTAAFLPNELMTQLSNQVRPKKEKERKKKRSIYEERNEFMCTSSDYDMLANCRLLAIIVLVPQEYLQSYFSFCLTLFLTHFNYNYCYCYSFFLLLLLLLPGSPVAAEYALRGHARQVRAADSVPVVGRPRGRPYRSHHGVAAGCC